MAFVFVKNAVKGYMAYQGLKRQAQAKSNGQKGQFKKSSASQKSDVFEAEYRVLRDE